MNWKNVVKNMAPALAATLGGPMSGVAVKYIADKFLGNPDATEDDFEEAIFNATPEKLAELKRIDNEFVIEMAKLDVDVYALEVKDRDSARDLAKINMKPQIILSSIFITGYFLLLFLIVSGHVRISLEIKETAILLLGILTTSMPMIMQFWFGSSSGSKEKTAKWGATLK